MRKDPVSSGDLDDAAESLARLLGQYEQSGINVHVSDDEIWLHTPKKKILVRRGSLAWEVWH
jgi:hypothetical protein